MHNEIRKRIEGVMLNRVKHIGDGEQTYTGTPNELMDELTLAVTKDYLIIKPARPA